MYTSTWCNHGHTRLVLVSFPTKEFDNFALMVALVKLALGGLWHPNFLQCGSSIWLSFDYVLWLPLVGPQTHEKHSQKPKIL
jgi:hypothetical protein